MKIGKRGIARLISIALASVMVLSLVSGCGNGKKSYDTETSPLRFSLQGADGVFNPFFSTAAYDSEIVGQTQLGMLTADKDGNVVYGDDEAVVTKDMTMQMYTDDYSTSMPGQSTGKTENGSQATRTEYRFLLKNGIKFSDGKPLTIKDVLFNLYVYLDPVYTGSATIYSTDIIGLAAYQTQEPTGDSHSMAALEATFAARANTRLQEILNYMTYLSELDSPTQTVQKPSAEKLSQIRKDLEFFKTSYQAEQITDYTSAISSLEDYRKKYTLTEAWQLYLYMNGLVSEKDLNNDNQINNNDKNDEGKYVLDFEDAGYQESIDAIMEDSSISDKDEAKKTWAIDTVYRALCYNEVMIDESAAEDIRADTGYAYLNGNIQYILQATNSATALWEEMKANEMSAYFQGIKDSGDLVVPNISGITTQEVTEFNGKKLDGTYDVLTININKVDPKAIWNFAFSVAPMHYYSNEAQCELWDGVSHFGVDYASSDFMNNVVKNPDKLGVPVGAGPYKASRNGGIPEGQYPTKTEFLSKNTVFFERNNNFESLGGSIKNAKIKYLTYQVVNTDQILNTLIADGIDVGDPSATTFNVNEVDKYKDSLTAERIKTNGYGYVGINPRYVPDIWVRRAIMRAMDTTIITKNYYTGGTAELIYRPMSSTSWAYPKGITVYKATAAQTYEKVALDYSYDKDGNEILKMLTSHGYQQIDGANGKELGKYEGGKWTQLSYTFTIAGDSEDHPAWTMFDVAKQTLNKIGFDIKVEKDSWALKKLATGSLAVWAAAWSSTIDPDMYQVYHKDSKASSVLNWGYDYIEKDAETYALEQQLVSELSKLIDQGRSTVIQSERANTYHKALDMVMELAVEMPTYQRCDMTVYNNRKIDPASLQQELTPLNSLFSKIWEVDYL